MSVPESVRQVIRPKNTVVIDTGSNGIHRYVVRERNGSICLKGRNPMPRNGKTIGHIINLEFVPKNTDVEKLSSDKPEWLSYGASALVHSLGHDILRDLLEVYDAKTAYSIMAIAATRITNKSTDSQLSEDYNSSFNSIFYPGVPLSAGTVHDLQKKLGANFTKRINFYKKRIETVSKEHHVAIDGMLKQDSSIVNDLSAYSRKAHIKQYKEISIIYAYNIELMEPICAQVFSGNIIDASAYETFLSQNDIKKGIIIADKGFPPSKISSILEKNKDLHFITPLKRNSKIIQTYNMTDGFEEPVCGIKEEIVCKKCRLKNGRYLYSFRNPSLAGKEETNYIKNSKIKNTFDKDKYEKYVSKCGIIVLESDLDLEPYVVYKSYKERWLIELVFKQYKNDLYFNTTRVHNNYTVLGAEFINFISSIITCRIIKKAEDVKILEEYTYGNMITALRRSMRKRTTDCNQLPSIDDNLWLNTTQKAFELLATLGLVSTPPVPEPKKRGRPKKEKPAASEFVGPKRRRGRPRTSPKKDTE